MLLLKHAMREISTMLERVSTLYQRNQKKKKPEITPRRKRRKKMIRHTTNQRLLGIASPAESSFAEGTFYEIYVYDMSLKYIIKY